MTYGMEVIQTPWGPKLAGEPDWDKLHADLEASGKNTVSVTPNGAVFYDASPETVAAAEGMPTISWQENEQRAAEITARAYEQGQALADLRKTVEESKAGSTWDELHPTGGASRTWDELQTTGGAGKNGDILLLSGLALLVLGLTRSRRRPKRQGKVRRG